MAPQELGRSVSEELEPIDVAAGVLRWVYGGTHVASGSLSHSQHTDRQASDAFNEMGTLDQDLKALRAKFNERSRLCCASTPERAGSNPSNKRPLVHCRVVTVLFPS